MSKITEATSYLFINKILAREMTVTLHHNSSGNKKLPQTEEATTKTSHSRATLVTPIAQLVEASAFRVAGCGFKSRSHHTKRVKKTGTSSSLADARIKRGCARKIV